MLKCARPMHSNATIHAFGASHLASCGLENKSDSLQSSQFFKFVFLLHVLAKAV